MDYFLSQKQKDYGPSEIKKLCEAINDNYKEEIYDRALYLYTEFCNKNFSNVNYEGMKMLKYVCFYVACLNIDFFSFRDYYRNKSAFCGKYNLNCKKFCKVYNLIKKHIDVDEDILEIKEPDIDFYI